MRENSTKNLVNNYGRTTTAIAYRRTNPLFSTKKKIKRKIITLKKHLRHPHFPLNIIRFRITPPNTAGFLISFSTLRRRVRGVLVPSSRTVDTSTDEYFKKISTKLSNRTFTVLKSRRHKIIKIAEIAICT